MSPDTPPVDVLLDVYLDGRYVRTVRIDTGAAAHRPERPASVQETAPVDFGGGLVADTDGRQVRVSTDHPHKTFVQVAGVRHRHGQVPRLHDRLQQAVGVVGEGAHAPIGRLDL